MIIREHIHSEMDATASQTQRAAIGKHDGLNILCTLPGALGIFLGFCGCWVLSFTTLLFLSLFIPRRWWTCNEWMSRNVGLCASTLVAPSAGLNWIIERFGRAPIDGPQ